jgi:hypothetical protein
MQVLGMSSGGDSGPLHPVPTRRSGYRYFFYNIHHRRDAKDRVRDGGPAQWLPELSHDQEFAIFDTADFHEVADEDGCLYGIRTGPGRTVLYLGTWRQQVAKFPYARPGVPWHGFPLGPLKEGPPNRKGEKPRPSKDVFDKMEKVGLLTAQQKNRLYKGEHV